MATINLTPLPFSTPMRRPGAGAEDWHNGSAAVGNVPEPMDVYYRFVWNKIEKAQGQYDWSYLDGLIQGAINDGKKLSFGIMSHRPEDGDGRLSYDGASSYYPLYLHNLMKAEPANSRDWISGGYWIPNFNSKNYIDRLKALNQAIRDHLVTTRYTATGGPNKGKSILLADAILFIDIRGFGTWGEWHTSSGMANWDQFPAGRQPTADSLKHIIETHTAVFDRWPLVIMIAAYDAGSSQFPVFHPYPDVAYYALTTKNAWGEVGFRKDQWAAKDEYLKKIAENNSRSYNGIALRSLIMDKWKKAPVTGEPMPGTASDLSDLVRQIGLYHATSFGNGNYGPTPNATQARYVEQAANLAGHKLQIAGGNFTNTDTALNITLNWLNGGNCPTYEAWDVLFFLSGKQVHKSTFEPKLFLPGAAPTPVSDTVALSEPAGKYELSIKVVDPTGYREPLPLYNEGRKADGSYTLGQVTISGTQPVPNQPPVVSAGADIEVTLPQSTVNLTGSATDKDGSIQSVKWERVSGSGSIVSPAANTTVIMGLSEGTSVFRFTGTDNDGASASDTVSIKVNQKPVEPAPERKLVDIKTTVKTETTFTAVYDDGSTEVIIK